jgi:hypothetical protein
MSSEGILEDVWNKTGAGAGPRGSRFGEVDEMAGSRDVRPWAGFQGVVV